MPDPIQPLQIQPSANAMVQALLGGAVPGRAEQLARLPQRMYQSAEQMSQGGGYDPAPFGDFMMQAATGGIPGVQTGALGAFGGKSMIPGQQGGIQLQRRTFSPMDYRPGTPQNFHKFNILSAEGQNIGELTGRTRDADTHFHVSGIRSGLPSDETSSFGGAPHSFGNINVKATIQALLGHFPKLEKLSGYRVTGAREKAAEEASEAAYQRGEQEPLRSDYAEFKIPDKYRKGPFPTPPEPQVGPRPGTMGAIFPGMADTTHGHLTPHEFVNNLGGWSNARHYFHPEDRARMHQLLFPHAEALRQRLGEASPTSPAAQRARQQHAAQQTLDEALQRITQPGWDQGWD